MARSFNGTSDKADTGAVATVATSNVAICCWAMRTATANSKTIFINGSTGTNGFAIGTDGSGNFTKVIGGVSTTSLGVVPVLNNWYHVLVQRDATTLNGYINGVLSGSGVTSTPVAATVKTSMGYDGTNTASCFPGLIMDCAVWNGPLSPAQISALANGVRPGSVSALGALDYLSISRSSIGYAKTSAGTLKWFPANTLRITDLGLLIEDARTNGRQASQTFDDATYWTLDNITISVNATAAPDGTTTADQFVENTSNSPHRLNPVLAHTVAAGSTVTGSVYLKAVAGSTTNSVNLDMSDNATGDIGTTIDLLTGVVSQTSLSAGEWTAWSGSSEALGNGWYRVTVTGTLGATRTNAGLKIQLIHAGNQAYTGDGSSGCYVWGAQVEAGSFASSYIPTTTSSATRAADAVTCTGSLDTVLSSLPLTAVMNVTSAAAATSTASFYRDNSNVFMYASASDTNVNSLISSVSMNVTAAAGAFSTGIKIGLGLASGARSLTIAGSSPATDTTAVAGSSGNISIGSFIGVGQGIFGYVRRFTAWNSKLADATLQSLTDPNITAGFPSAGATIDMDFTTSRYYSSLQALAPVGWWSFDGYASPEPDLSSGGHNATLTGTARVLGPGIVARATGS